jgi:hypothetical protein
MAISDPAVSAPGKILMQIAKKALIFILLGINSYCRSYPEPDEMQEYYFYGKYTQLHGLARVPARTIDKEKATVTTLGERRNACREEASKPCGNCDNCDINTPRLKAAESPRRTLSGSSLFARSITGPHGDIAQMLSEGVGDGLDDGDDDPF